ATLIRKLLRTKPDKVRASIGERKLMNHVTFEYQVMGFGNWISATVSADIANTLAEEYRSYGWPVKIS
ncbi:hypothetical protein L4C31_16635, partial [Aliivibrio sifiae]